MQFKEEKNTKRIKEFLDLVENHKVELRRYKNPVLVYSVNDGVCYYSFWEDETLGRFGLENVDGWDFEEDTLFCPDWVDDSYDDDFDDDDDDDEDLGLVCDLIKPKP